MRFDHLWYGVLCSLIFVSAQGDAQTAPSSPAQPSAGSAAQRPGSWLFAPSDSTIQWSRYHNIEQCDAAFQRAQSAANAEIAFQGLTDGVPDTILYRRASAAADSDYTAVLNTTRVCLTQFPLQRMASRELPIALDLYIAAHDDARLDSVVERQIVELHTTSQKERAGILDGVIGKTVMQSQTRHRDRRPDLSKRYFAAMHTRFPGAVFTRAFRAVFLNPIFNPFDTTQLSPSLLRGIVQSVRTISEEKPSEPFEESEKSSLRSMDSLFVKVLDYAALMEQGTAAWAQRAEHCDSICSDAPWAEFKVPLPIITGAYWYRDGAPIPGVGHATADRATAGTQPQTTPLLPTGQSRAGHPTIVLFGDSTIPAQTLVFLRDLQREFPALDMTIVPSTTGQQRGTGTPVPPAVEADSEQKYIFHTINLRATVVVDTAYHKTLPAPDNRWFRAPGKMLTELAHEGRGALFLLDAQGRVILDSRRDLIGSLGGTGSILRPIVRRLMLEMQ